jgi:copper chaperone CopZ
MSDEVRELEMRVEARSGPAGAGEIEAALRAVDPGLRVRVDPATGIVHIETRRDTLEIVAALTEAGFEASAETM